MKIISVSHRSKGNDHSAAAEHDRCVRCVQLQTETSQGPSASCSSCWSLRGNCPWSGKKKIRNRKALRQYLCSKQNSKFNQSLHSLTILWESAAYHLNKYKPAADPRRKKHRYFIRKGEREEFIFDITMVLFGNYTMYNTSVLHQISF